VPRTPSPAVGGGPPPLPWPPDEPVPSPCVSVCRMDASERYCIGCLRTLDEIAAWSRLDDADRRLVWQAIAQRRAAAARHG